MPWKQDQPGCDCCGCERVDDDFSTDTISNYSQMSGTWSISGGQLSTSSANAVLKAVTTGLVYQQLATRFKSPDRKTVKLLGGMSSGTVYLYAQVEFDSSGTCGWLEIRNKTAIADSRIGERRRLDNLDPDQWHELTLCIQPYGDLSKTAVYATLNGACLFAELAQTPSVGAGLGTGSGSDTVYFDSFSWSDSKSTDNECPECGCPCEATSDDFERTEAAGADDIGCLWEVCANSWEISNGFLVGSGDANTQHLVPIDARSKEQYASVLCRGQQGTKALLYLGYACGESSMCAVIEFWDAPGKSKLAISNDNGSTYYEGWRFIDLSGWLDADGFVTLEACLTANTFYTRAAGERVSASGASAGDDKFAGLGVRYHDNGTPETGRLDPVWFDDFQSGLAGSPCGDCDLVAAGTAGGCCKCTDQQAPATVLITQPALATGSGSTGVCVCADASANVLAKFGRSDKIGSTCMDDLCCYWSGNSPTGCIVTNDSGGTLKLCKVGSDYKLTYTLIARWFGSVDYEAVWSKNFGSTLPDCMRFNETLTLESTTGVCDATGTTVTVKAV
jgi:hypothetical protein